MVMIFYEGFIVTKVVGIVTKDGHSNIIRIGLDFLSQ